MSVSHQTGFWPLPSANFVFRIHAQARLPPSRQCAPNDKNGGAGRDRTDDLMLAKQLLSQLSYSPILGKASSAGGDIRRLRLSRASARAPVRACEPSARNATSVRQDANERAAFARPTGRRAPWRVSLRTRTCPPAPEAPSKMVGLGRLERPTSPLSGVRSNHLSYRPRMIEHASMTMHRSRYPE